VRIAGEATFHIYVEGAKAKHGQIAWAKQVKPVTFDLSEHEKEVLKAAGLATTAA